MGGGGGAAGLVAVPRPREQSRRVESAAPNARWQAAGAHPTPACCPAARVGGRAQRQQAPAAQGCRGGMPPRSRPLLRGASPAPNHARTLVAHGAPRQHQEGVAQGTQVVLAPASQGVAHLDGQAVAAAQLGRDGPHVGLGQRRVVGGRGRLGRFQGGQQLLLPRQERDCGGEARGAGSMDREPGAGVGGGGGVRAASARAKGRGCCARARSTPRRWPWPTRRAPVNGGLPLQSAKPPPAAAGRLPGAAAGLGRRGCHAWRRAGHRASVRARRRRAAHLPAGCAPAGAAHRSCWLQPAQGGRPGAAQAGRRSFGCAGERSLPSGEATGRPALTSTSRENSNSVPLLLLRLRLASRERAGVRTAMLACPCSLFGLSGCTGTVGGLLRLTSGHAALGGGVHRRIVSAVAQRAVNVACCDWRRNERVEE